MTRALLFLLVLPLCAQIQDPRIMPGTVGRAVATPAMPIQGATALAYVPPRPSLAPFYVSVATLGVCFAVDDITSMRPGLRENNALFARNGVFQPGRAVAVQVGITAAVAFAGRAVARRWPRTGPWVTGAVSAMAARECWQGVANARVVVTERDVRLWEEAGR